MHTKTTGTRGRINRLGSQHICGGDFLRRHGPSSSTPLGFPINGNIISLATPTRRLSPRDDQDDDGVPSSPLDRPLVSMIDAAAIVAFAAIGKASHNADGSLDLLSVFMTAVPFLVSWFAIAPIAGCFTPTATTSGDIKQSVIYTARGWILAIPVGCLLRGVVKGYIPPTPFIIVTMIATLVLLSAGRAAYTAASGLYMELF